MTVWLLIVAGHVQQTFASQSACMASAAATEATGTQVKCLQGTPSGAQHYCVEAVPGQLVCYAVAK